VQHCAFTDVDFGDHLDLGVCEMRRNIELLLELQQAPCCAERSMGRIENIVRGKANDCVTRGRGFESSQRIMHNPIKSPTSQQLLPLAPSTTKFEPSHLITLTTIEIRFSPNLSKIPRTLRAAGIKCPQGVPESQPRLER
jgi:hypothetical protein